MFNWYSTPTFAAALLFWLLAAYVLSRSAWRPVSLTAVVALAGTSAYLLGQGMQANAPTLDAWRPWPSLHAAAPIATAAWYLVTLLLLDEQPQTRGRSYVRLVGRPVGLVVGGAGLVFAVLVFVGDWLYAWSAPIRITTDSAPSVRYVAPTGPFYPGFVVFVLVAAIGAVANLWVGWGSPLERERRRRFGWLLLGAMLFLPEVLWLAVAYWRPGLTWPGWINHLALSGAMAVMASNVAGYSRPRHSDIVAVDLFYFLLAWLLICLLYAFVFVVVGQGFSFDLLALLVVTLLLVIISNAIADPARRLLDRVFFGREVEHLRSRLTAVTQGAALASDLGALLDEAQTEIAEASDQHFVKLTEEALRRLNRPAALADCGLAAQIPGLLATTMESGETGKPEETPLARAHAVRDVLTTAIDQLRPTSDAAPLGAPSALQYQVLHAEYVLGTPIRQIMTRLSISESTFHRHRREAIAVVARELRTREALLART